MSSLVPLNMEHYDSFQNMASEIHAYAPVMPAFLLHTIVMGAPAVNLAVGEKPADVYSCLLLLGKLLLFLAHIFSPLEARKVCAVKPLYQPHATIPRLHWYVGCFSYLYII